MTQPQIVAHSVPITTTSLGAATVYSGPVAGNLVKVDVVKGTLADGTDFTITGETSAQPLLTITNMGAASLWLYPRCAPVNTSNSAITNAHSPMPLLNERIKVVVAQGGDTKSGSIVFYVEESP